MIRLTKEQLEDKIKFIDDYIAANNAATGSTVDANANVTTKNIATLSTELNKDTNIQIKRRLIYNKLKEIFDIETARNYTDQLEKHEIYTHDESALMPYCAAVSLYPFLLDGLQPFGGESKAPKHLSSFNGGFVNLMFALTSQFAGAVATVEYLMCFDYFAKKDYGTFYLTDNVEIIKQELQQVVHALNQPASARGFQSCFWNISIFDKYYFESLFGNFVFPDGTKPYWESISELQQFFMKWFNKERTKALLTFPIVTVSVLNNGTSLVDEEYKELIAQELSEGNSFFIYTSPTVDSLSSCCRLRNNITDQINDFSYSLGAGGVMTGSINVITLNMNRFVQNVINSEPYEEEKHLPDILWALRHQILNMHKYQFGFKALYQQMIDQNMLPAYKAQFIDIDKQYMTIGVNGLMEAAEYLGYTPDINKGYIHFIDSILKTISDTNKETCDKYPNTKINTELVPAENLGVKFALWDFKSGLVVPRLCYNSYLYPVENETINIIDKCLLHGNVTTKHLDGGSALHLNLEDYPDKDTCEKIVDIAVSTGCNYFCFNVKITICDDCGHIDKHTLYRCSNCDSKNIAYATRVIGYLRRIDNFSAQRQVEAYYRHYHELE